MTHVNPILRQDAFRGRVDSGNEATPTWIVAADTNWTQAVDADFRVRFVIQETAGASNPSTVTPLVFYSINGGGYAAVTASTPIQFGTFTGATDDDATTAQLGAGTFVTGRLDDSGAVTTADIQGSETEYEYCLSIDSAQVANSDTITLQVYDSATPLDQYGSVPSITVLEADPPIEADIPATAYTLTAPVPTFDLVTVTDFDIGLTTYTLAAPVPTFDIVTVTDFDIGLTTYALTAPAPAYTEATGYMIGATTYTLTAPASILTQEPLFRLQTGDVLDLSNPAIPGALQFYAFPAIDVGLTAYALTAPAPSFTEAVGYLVGATTYTLTAPAPSFTSTTGYVAETAAYTLTAQTPILTPEPLFKLQTGEVLDLSNPLIPGALQLYSSPPIDADIGVTAYALTAPAPSFTEVTDLDIGVTAYTETAQTPILTPEPLFKLQTGEVLDLSNPLIPGALQLYAFQASIGVTAYTETAQTPILTPEPLFKLQTGEVLDLSNPLIPGALQLYAFPPVEADVGVTAYALTAPAPTYTVELDLNVGVTAYILTAFAPGITTTSEINVGSTDYTLTVLDLTFDLPSITRPGQQTSTSGGSAANSTNSAGSRNNTASATGSKNRTTDTSTRNTTSGGTDTKNRTG